jgi:uncharacterized protein with FMN-binding domain
MKRSLLIAGGTVGGLGAVLAITPPQISSTSSVSQLPGASVPTAANPAAQSTKSVTKATPSAKATTSRKPSATQSSKPAASATTPAAAPTTAAPTTAAPSGKSVNGTFTGNAVDVGYGTVQVKITVANGKITDAQAVQAPSGRNDRYTNMSVPVLRQRTLAAQSANINGVSGASYTSYGWYTSLVSALKQAGL